jgi:hypothetical protein
MAKPNTKTQRERFEETARQLECDEDEAKFNADLKKIAQVKVKSEKDGTGEGT